ncbi:something about silencing protein 10-like [Amphibalanus amphitrite]|uniref:something about silencing protein 10-like n=1 Tax=Amphibalanus amphitrite TaxID=1232801 RepID=UPI001C91BD95|nr:something about silencing protein 10-like [Amphibalanus amphitrite]XP_043245874.1 something about silencing protein 10-like [Amphibalanus amphitrite]
MGRRKTRGRRPAAAASAAAGSDDELVRSELDEDEMRDELDEFELRRERALLADGGGASGRPAAAAAVRSKHTEVLAFDDDDSASDDEYGQLPDGDAAEEVDGAELSGGWGKRKASYYSTDQVDEDWRGATREETLEAAELEEREARAIQRRLAEQLEHDQLEFGTAAVTPTAGDAAPSAGALSVPLDTSGLSRAERLQLLRRRCPELLPLLDEFSRRAGELAAALEPARGAVTRGQAAGPGAAYVTVRRRLLLLYCLNISHYVTLRAGRGDTDSHPVMRRIAQCGRLLEALAPADRAMAPHLERLRRLLADGVPLRTVAAPDAAPAAAAAPAPAGRRLKAARRRAAPAPTGAQSEVDRQLASLTMEIEGLERQKHRLAAEKKEAGPTFTERRRAGQERHNPLTPFRRKERPAEGRAGGGGPAAAADPGPADPADAEHDPDQKRSITYQMAKNKGLMPKRSRESRNPRVKHKEKFKRALKKRRSLVRLPKKELQKYGGEVFGIRMGAVKSVSIK